jgi:hypothetical protein
MTGERAYTNGSRRKKKTYLEELEDMSWKLSQQLHPSSPNSIDILRHTK